MRMICFECKKMIFQRGILLLILLLALINVGKTVIYLHYNPTVSGVGAMSREKGHRNVLKEYQGEMTEEKAKQLRKAQDDLYKSLTGDGEYHREDEEKNTIVNEYQYQYTYQFAMQEHLDAAGDNERFYQARGNTGQVRYNRLIRKLYGDRFIENYYQCSHYDVLFDYQFSTLLLLIFAGVLSLRFFYLEKESIRCCCLWAGRGRKSCVPSMRFFFWGFWGWDVCCICRILCCFGGCWICTGSGLRSMRCRVMRLRRMHCQFWDFT